MSAPIPATAPPTVREVVAQYVEQLPPATTPDKLQVLGAALHALLGPAMEEPVNTLTPMRLLILGGELKGRVSPKTGRPLAASTFRRYVLIAQEFWAWCEARWPPAAEQPSQGAEETGERTGRHLGDLIRLLRTSAGLTRQQLGSGTKIGEVALKHIELGRRLPTRAQLDQLLTAPAMSGLLAWAEKKGVPVEVAPEQGPDPSGFHRVEGDKP